MGNSESATRVSTDATGAPGPGRLVEAAGGRPLRVVAIDEVGRASLASEGLDVGVEVSVERRLAFGGPLIVRVGRARLALARGVAAGVWVEPVEGPGPQC